MRASSRCSIRRPGAAVEDHLRTNPDALREAARFSKASANQAINSNLVPNIKDGERLRDNPRVNRRAAAHQNFEFVRFGIYILGNLAVTDAVKMEIGIQSGIQLILQAITVHFDELSLIKNAYYSLATLTFGHPINCAFIMASQGIGLTRSAR
jgi:hypothetical protein